MGFLNLWYLWFLPLIVIPVMLNLLRHRKVKTVEFPYFNLLAESIVSNIAKIKIMNVLLTFVRVLLLLCLIMFMAKPILSKSGDGSAGDKNAPAVFIIDNSKSMDCPYKGEPPFLRARYAIRENIMAMGEKVPCAVVYMNRAGKMETARQFANPRDLLSNLNGIDTVNHRFNPQKAFDLAEGFLKSTGKPRGDIYFFTDNQDSNWQTAGKINISKGTSVHFVVPPPVVSESAGISGWRFEDKLAKEGERGKITAVLSSYSRSKQITAPLRFYVDNELIEESLVTLEPNQSMEKDFFYTSGKNGKNLKAEIKLDYDDFDIDNTIKIVLPYYPNPKIYLLTGGEDNIFLKSAVKTYLNNPYNFLINIKSIDEVDNAKPGGILILTLNSKFSGDTSRIVDIIEKGVAVIAFYSSDETVGEKQPASVSNADFSSYVLSPYKKFGKEAFGELMVTSSIHKLFLPEIKQRQTLLASPNSPFMEKLTLGDGIIYVFYADASGKTSNFISSSLFLPIFCRSVDSLLALRHGNPSGFNKYIGDNLEISRDAPFSAQWVNPKKETVVLNGVYASGKYHIENPPVTAQGYYTLIDGKTESEIAYNILPDEGNLQQIGRDKLDAVFSGAKISYYDMFSKSGYDVLGEKTGAPEVLIYLCILLYIIELAIANFNW